MVNPTVQAILELFAHELASVQFPDVDKKILDAGSAAVRQAEAALAQAEAALERARADLASAEDALAQRAQRGLAYARVFAEGNTDLAAKLEAIAPSANAPVELRRRRRDAPLLERKAS